MHFSKWCQTKKTKKTQENLEKFCPICITLLFCTFLCRQVLLHDFKFRRIRLNLKSKWVGMIAIKIQKLIWGDFLSVVFPAIAVVVSLTPYLHIWHLAGKITSGSHRSHSHCLKSPIDLKRHKGIFVPSTSLLRRSSAGYPYKNSNDRKSRKSAGDNDDVARTLSFSFSTASPQHKEASVEERVSAQKKCGKLKPDSPGYVLVKAEKILMLSLPFKIYLAVFLVWVELHYLRFGNKMTPWQIQ